MAFDFPNSPTLGQTATGIGGVVYIWDGTKWASSLGNVTTQSMGDVGRNFIHNPLFNVPQRGAGPFTTTGTYTLDRWIMALTSDTASISQGTFSDAGRTAIGDEAAVSNLANTFTGNAAAGAFNFVTQWIEGVRRLGGKTVTVSFWAAAASGTPKLGVSIDQFFGSAGGGGSSYVSGVGQSVTLSSTWTRYSLTFTIASTVGKTLSTSLSDCTGLNFWYSSGATNNTRAGGIGVQSGPFSVYIWGVQLEIGSVATPLEKPDPRYDLSNCQRFYAITSCYTAYYAAAGGGVIGTSFYYPVTMRASPTMTFANTGNTNIGAVTVQNSGSQPSSGLAFALTTAGSTSSQIQGNIIMSADL